MAARTPVRGEAQPTDGAAEELGSPQQAFFQPTAEQQTAARAASGQLPQLPPDGINALVERASAVWPSLPEDPRKFKPEDVRLCLKSAMRAKGLLKDSDDIRSALGASGQAPITIVSQPAYYHCKFYVDAAALRELLANGGSPNAMDLFATAVAEQQTAFDSGRGKLSSACM